MIFYAKSTEKEVLAKLVFSNKIELSKFLIADQEEGYKGNYVVTIKRETKVRTLKQNDSLHLYFEILANKLNEAGLGMREVLKESVYIEWTKENVKQYLWKPLQKILTGKESTADLDKTTEINKIYSVLDRHLSESPRINIHVPFPTEKKEEFDIQTAHANLEVPEGKITAF